MKPTLHLSHSRLDNIGIVLLAICHEVLSAFSGEYHWISSSGHTFTDELHIPPIYNARARPMPLLAFCVNFSNMTSVGKKLDF